VLVDGTPATTLVVEVRDDGPGVPLAERERIFEPFVTTRVTGTGLGLSIARKLVELHGGRLSLLDRTAGGACFRVELPREDR
jgi:signal transduction histidine kinase